MLSFLFDSLYSLRYSMFSLSTNYSYYGTLPHVMPSKSKIVFSTIYYNSK